MTNDELQQAIEDVSCYIRRDVASGFARLDRVVPNTLEVVCDEYPVDELRPHAERVLREAIDEQLKQQATWPAVTDCDRFDAAFADLERAARRRQDRCRARRARSSGTSLTGCASSPPSWPATTASTRPAGPSCPPPRSPPTG